MPHSKQRKSAKKSASRKVARGERSAHRKPKSAARPARKKPAPRPAPRVKSKPSRPPKPAAKPGNSKPAKPVAKGSAKKSNSPVAATKTPAPVSVVVAKPAPPAKNPAPAKVPARGANKAGGPLGSAAKIAVLKAAIHANAKSAKTGPRTLIQTGKPIIQAGAGGVRVVRPQRAAPAPSHGDALPPSRGSLSFGARSSVTLSTAAKSTKAMNRKSSFKKADLQRYQLKLLEKRESLAGDLRSMEKQAFRQSGTESAPNHMADYGSDTFEQDFTLGLIESDEKVVGQIDAALVRIEKGGFGICEACFEDIPKARLDVLPWAALCVTCQSQVERS
jgi:DnaK suppressor protein